MDGGGGSADVTLRRPFKVRIDGLRSFKEWFLCIYGRRYRFSNYGSDAEFSLEKSVAVLLGFTLESSEEL